MMRLPIPVLLYIIAVVLPIGFSVGPVYLTGVRILLLILIVPLIVRLFLGKYGPIIATDIFFFLHLSWVIVSLWVNNPNLAIQNAGSTGIEFIGGYLLGRAYIRNQADFISLTFLLSIVIVVLMPFAFYEAFTGRPIVLEFLNKIPGISSLPKVYSDKRMGLNRVQMNFVHPIHWGLFCSLVVSLVFVGLKGSMSNLLRIILSGFITIGGLLALSSGALLAIILQFGLVVWAAIFRKSSNRWLILLACFLVFYVLVDALSDRSPIMVFLSYATFSAHTAYWRTIIFEWGMINVWANPIFGLGLNDWIRPVWMYSGSMDNFWLLMGVRYGIPGFTFIAAGYGIAIWKIGFRKFNDDIVLWSLRRAWMFSFLGLSFTISTVHIWHTIYSFVFFMFGSGIWMLTANANGGVNSSSNNNIVDRPKRSKLHFRNNSKENNKFSRFERKFRK